MTTVCLYPKCTSGQINYCPGGCSMRRSKKQTQEFVKTFEADQYIKGWNAAVATAGTLAQKLYNDTGDNIAFEIRGLHINAEGQNDG